MQACLNSECSFNSAAHQNNINKLIAISKGGANLFNLNKRPFGSDLFLENTNLPDPYDVGNIVLVDEEEEGKRINIFHCVSSKMVTIFILFLSGTTDSLYAQFGILGGLMSDFVPTLQANLPSFMNFFNFTTTG